MLENLPGVWDRNAFPTCPVLCDVKVASENSAACCISKFRKDRLYPHNSTPSFAKHIYGRHWAVPLPTNSKPSVVYKMQSVPISVPASPSSLTWHCPGSSSCKSKVNTVCLHLARPGEQKNQTYAT